MRSFSWIVIPFFIALKEHLKRRGSAFDYILKADEDFVNSHYHKSVVFVGFKPGTSTKHDTSAQVEWEKGTIC